MKFIAGCLFYFVGTLAVVALVVVSCRPNDGLSVLGASVPPTVPGQTVGAAYMQLLSKRNATLVKVDADVASAVEIHQTTTDYDNKVRMRPLESLELPAGQAVELKTGATHLMLLDLKRPLKTGDTVNLTLTLRLGQGRYAQEQAIAKVGRSDKPERQQ